jgi:hypothetical protein
MYSAKSPETDTSIIYTLEYNDSKIFLAPHTWKDHQRMMFFYTIDYYAYLIDNGNVERNIQRTVGVLNKLHVPQSVITRLPDAASAVANYPAWLKRYMQSNMRQPLDSIKVYRRWLKYNNDGSVHEVKNQLLFKA